MCGIDWLNSYIHTLSEEEEKQIVEVKSKTSFRFGDGQIQNSIKKVKIPVTLVGKKVFIMTDVVDSGLPLLFSKPSMKKAGVKLDLENDTAIILGKTVKLNCTSSGHYCIPLYDERKIEEAMFTFEGNEKELKRKVGKLHHQFGHPTYKRLTIVQ